MITEQEIAVALEHIAEDEWICVVCGTIFTNLQIPCISHVLCSEGCVKTAQEEGEKLTFVDLRNIDM